MPEDQRHTHTHTHTHTQNRVSFLFYDLCGGSDIEKRALPRAFHQNEKTTLENHMDNPKMLDPYLSVEVWAEEARDDIPFIRHFRVALFLLHCFLTVFYLFVSCFTFLFVSLVPFQNAAGTCLEQRFPLGLIIAIYNSVNFCEQVSYLIWYGTYWHWLYRWQSPRRWIIRAVNGAFFSTFISELGCAYNFETVVMTSIFYVGSITSFLHFQKTVSYEYACRSVRAYLRLRHDARYVYIPKYRTSVYDTYVAWFKVFVPIFPSLFQLWWLYIDTGNGVGSDDVSWLIFIIYGFAVIQAIGIVGIPALVHAKRKKNAEFLFPWFLAGEVATLLVFLICDVGIALSYVFVTRYPG